MGNHCIVWKLGNGNCVLLYMYLYMLQCEEHKKEIIMGSECIIIIYGGIFVHNIKKKKQIKNLHLKCAQKIE